MPVSHYRRSIADPLRIPSCMLQRVPEVCWCHTSIVDPLRIPSGFPYSLSSNSRGILRVGESGAVFYYV